MPFSDKEKEKEYRREQARLRRERAKQPVEQPEPAALPVKTPPPTVPSAHPPVKPAPAATLVPPPVYEKTPSRPRFREEEHVTEKFWETVGIKNAWTQYQEQEGFPCANGLGRCCLPYMFHEIDSTTPLKAIGYCKYEARRCIYFRNTGNQSYFEL